MALDLAFGSFDFSIANKASIESISDTLLTSTDFSERVLADGSQLVRSNLIGRELAIRGTVGGTTAADARTKLQAMMTALRNGEQNFQINDDRVLPCILAGNLTYKNVRGTGFTLYEWDCRLRSEEAFWQDPTPISDSFTKTGAGPWTDDFKANNGSAPVYPVLNLQNNGSGLVDKTLTFTNLSTNEVLKLHAIDWTGLVDMVVDFDLRLVHDGSGNPQFAGTIEGDWWSIPGGGSIVTLQVEHDIGGSADIDFVTTFNERYDNY